MTGDVIYSRSEMLIAVALFFVSLVAAEGGYRLGRHSRETIDEPTRLQVSSIQGAILGLLGLLLGFTFAMAVSRFDARKHLVVDEANAIGTAILRARLFPPPRREEVDTLLRSYVDARLKVGGAQESGAEFASSEAEADRLQRQLWALTVTVAVEDTRSVTAALFIESLNDAFDSKSRRDAALSNHVPESVLALLFLASLIAMSVIGYAVGLAGARVNAAIGGHGHRRSRPP
jgi:hypothetical protein